MKTKQILLTAMLAAMLAPALAEDTADAAQEVRREVRVERVDPSVAPHEHAYARSLAVAGMEHMPFGAGGMRIHAKAVKNAPYSAEAISERQQVLGDGNQIASQHSSRVYRDSQGRTRQEIRDDKGALRTILIDDGSATLILRPEDKTGTRIERDGGEITRLAREHARMAGERAKLAGDRARERIEILRKEGTLARAEGDKAREAMIVRRVERAEEAGRERAEEIRVRVHKQMEGKTEQLRRLAPMIARAAGDSQYARNATTKDLGMRDMEGIRAEGKMTSYEIPAGEMGNAKPIVVTSETWYSPELQVTVYSKHSDPRSGDRIYRLDNIRRDEPPAELFVAPSDYTIKDPVARLKEKLKEKEKK